MIKSTNNKLFETLKELYGKKRAKEILKEIQELKENNPDQAYSFIFREDGTFIAHKKNQEQEKDIS